MGGQRPFGPLNAYSSFPQICALLLCVPSLKMPFSCPKKVSMLISSPKKLFTKSRLVYDKTKSRFTKSDERMDTWSLQAFSVPYS